MNTVNISLHFHLVAIHKPPDALLWAPRELSISTVLYVLKTIFDRLFVQLLQMLYITFQVIQHKVVCRQILSSSKYSVWQSGKIDFINWSSFLSMGGLFLKIGISFQVICSMQLVLLSSSLIHSQ